jgi:hypothetical protein
MTVENDGVPLTEADPEPDGLESATELLPLDAASATKQAADDAAARKAALNSPASPAPRKHPVPPAPPTERLPVPPPETSTAPPAEQPEWPTETVQPEEPTRLLPLDQPAPGNDGTTTRGSMGGDLFDEADPTHGRAP